MPWESLPLPPPTRYISSTLLLQSRFIAEWTLIIRQIKSRPRRSLLYLWEPCLLPVNVPLFHRCFTVAFYLIQRRRWHCPVFIFGCRDFTQTRTIVDLISIYTPSSSIVLYLQWGFFAVFCEFELEGQMNQLFLLFLFSFYSTIAWWGLERAAFGREQWAWRQKQQNQSSNTAINRRHSISTQGFFLQISSELTV